MHREICVYNVRYLDLLNITAFETETLPIAVCV